jgi:hypothetical protein
VADCASRGFCSPDHGEDAEPDASEPEYRNETLQKENAQHPSKYLEPAHNAQKPGEGDHRKEPMSVSTEAKRNWHPGGTMEALTNRKGGAVKSSSLPASEVERRLELKNYACQDQKPRVLTVEPRYYEAGNRNRRKQQCFAHDGAILHPVIKTS